MHQSRILCYHLKARACYAWCKPASNNHATRSFSSEVAAPKRDISWQPYKWSKDILIRNKYATNDDLLLFLKAVGSTHARAVCHPTQPSADKLQATYDDDFWSRDWRKRGKLREWYTLGPPPLSEYKLTFGKHKGKRLEEVPDVYLVKYLVPRRKDGVLGLECPIVQDAIEDFLKRHPYVKSQAGPRKTTPLKEGVAKDPEVKRKPGRPPKSATRP